MLPGVTPKKLKSDDENKTPELRKLKKNTNHHGQQKYGKQLQNTHWIPRFCQKFLKNNDSNSENDCMEDEPHDDEGNQLPIPLNSQPLSTRILVVITC